jgi:signal transduction histidine kinase
MAAQAQPFSCARKMRRLQQARILFERFIWTVSMSFKTKLILGFGTALFLLVSSAVLSYKSFVADDSDRAWVAHTHLVMEKLDNVLADLIDGETGVRAFIISGDELYLQPYREGLARIDQDVRDLRTLTADNHQQQAELDRLEPALRNKLAEFAEEIDLRKQKTGTNDQTLRQGIGKPTMDRLRSQIAEMKSIERQLLLQRSNTADASSQKTKRLIVAGNLLAITFLLFAGVVISREMRRRRSAEEEVRELNSQLERRVEERTAELRARERELSRSNEELQQFAYVASHDLQEPLRMVASFTQLLAKRYNGQLDNDARDFIKFAVDGATRMQTLIGDLLTYSRVGTQMKPLEPVSCERIVDQVLSTFRLAISENHASITRGPLPEVMADRTQLSQLFQNLISNAMKFRREDAPRIHISAEMNGAGWKFTVSDNGIGIQKEHEQRIFVIFQRLHTKVEYPGTGIGLAICKKIVERHGGRIWIEPSPEHGTTFCFTLTAARPLKSGEGEQHADGTRVGFN